MSDYKSVSVFSDLNKYSRTVGQQELNKIVLHCMSILVKNAIGTSRWKKPSTGESSWLEYWENHVGHKATHCGAIDCRSSYNLVGAHVKKAFGDDRLYITPLCGGCNQRTGTFWVDTELVPVPSRL